MKHRLFDGIDEPGLNTLEVYRRERGGYEMLSRALQMEPADMLELQASGLRGRGGAGFAMGTKASFLPKGDMDKYVVCNADESEPGTFKDRELMQKNPHLLIEGVAIAAHAVGANKRVHLHPRRVRLRRDDPRDRVSREAEGGETPRSARSTCGSTAAPAPTSAARRRRCSTRSRASAATRGSSRRSRPSRASTRGRR